MISGQRSGCFGKKMMHWKVCWASYGLHSSGKGQVPLTDYSASAALQLCNAEALLLQFKHTAVAATVSQERRK